MHQGCQALTAVTIACVMGLGCVFGARCGLSVGHRRVAAMKHSCATAVIAVTWECIGMYPILSSLGLMRLSMRRFVTACLAFLVFGAMLSTSPAGAGEVLTADKTLATCACGEVAPAAVLPDTSDGDIDELAGHVFLASRITPASGVVSPLSSEGLRQRSAQSIRAPPQHL